MRSKSLSGRFFEELHRRRVPRTAAIYAIVAVSTLEMTDIYADVIGLHPGVTAFLALLAVFGFPVALILSWIFRVTPETPWRTDPDAGDPDEEDDPPNPGPREWAVAVLSVLVAVVTAAVLSAQVGQ